LRRIIQLKKGEIHTAPRGLKLHGGAGDRKGENHHDSCHCRHRWGKQLGRTDCGAKGMRGEVGRPGKVQTRRVSIKLLRPGNQQPGKTGESGTAEESRLSTQAQFGEEEGTRSLVIEKRVRIRTRRPKG